MTFKNDLKKNMKKYNIKEKFEKRCQYSGKMRNKNYYYLENSDELERIQKWKNTDTSKDIEVVKEQLF